MENSANYNGSAQKPLLPMGWVISANLRVKGFIERKHFTEVYETNEGTYLYLFLGDTLRQKIVDRLIDHLVVHVTGHAIPAKIYPTHGEEEFRIRVQEIIERRGLQAIAGMNELKLLLTRDVVHPFLNRDAYAKYKLNTPNGILLFGPPGCGKTYIARRLAEELNAQLFEIRESNVGSPFIHATSGNIARAFRDAFKAAPAVLFIDEVSGLLPRRDRMSEHNQYRESEVNEFLMNLESAGSRGVLVVAATNFPDRLDQAAIRSGRMDKRIFVPPPDYSARVELFRMELEDRPVGSHIVPEVLGQMSEGFVASDIKLSVDNAAREALGANDVIRMDHLTSAVKRMTPSMSQQELEKYAVYLKLQRV